MLQRCLEYGVKCGASSKVCNAFADEYCMLKGDKNTCVVNDDVAGFSGSLGANHAGARDDLADQGVLLLGNVHLNIGLIPVAGPHMKRFRSFLLYFQYEHE
jgi:hypothetical protein